MSALAPASHGIFETAEVGGKEWGVRHCPLLLGVLCSGVLSFPETFWKVPMLMPTKVMVYLVQCTYVTIQRMFIMQVWPDLLAALHVFTVCSSTVHFCPFHVTH